MQYNKRAGNGCFQKKIKQKHGGLLYGSPRSRLRVKYLLSANWKITSDFSQSCKSMAEAIPVTLRDLSTISNTFIEKIHFLESPTSSLQCKAKLREDLIDIAEKLKEFFSAGKLGDAATESEKLFYDRVQRLFDQFQWEINFCAKPHEFRKYAEYGKSLMSGILKLLGKKGCGILIIETYIKLCTKALADMHNNHTHLSLQDDIMNFKLLLNGLSCTVNLFTKYWHIVFSSSQKSSLLLCLSQICKCLQFLLKITKEGNVNAKKYLLDRLMQCFNCIFNELHYDEGVPARGVGSEFIELMDSALRTLNQLCSDTLDLPSLIEIASGSEADLKLLIDELLCHAMSIAQVTHIENDYNSIVATSQKVLSDFSELSIEIQKKDGCGIKLNASSISETLCRLEQKVNTAVLRLVLEVFTDVNSPVKKMVTKCRLNSSREDKTSDDLNVLISDFDIGMDRIMQIGLFAISCSSDVKRVLEIRSCLASLESLEAELIPCLSRLYVDPDDGNKSNFQFLIDHWLKEITELKILVDSIIDPAAFSEVVENQVKSLLVSLKEELSSSTPSLKKAKDIVQLILKFSKKLVKTLLTSVKDEEPENAKKAQELISRLQLSIQECEAADYLLEEQEGNIKTLRRLVKRCDLVANSIHTLLEFLVNLLQNDNFLTDYSDATAEKEDFTFGGNSTRLPKGNYYKLCTSVCETTPPPSVVEALTPFIQRGKRINKERSGLYTTPMRVQDEQLQKFGSSLMATNRCWDKTPRSRNRSRYCKPISRKLELENSLDLEITTILEKLSQLSNTFNTTECPCEYTTQIPTGEKSKVVESRDFASKQEKDVDDTKPMSSSSGCLAKISEKAKPLHIEEDGVDEDNSRLGSKFRSTFLRSLDELSQDSSLSATKDSDQVFDTPVRLNDLRVVERKIDFLKQQFPEMLS